MVNVLLIKQLCQWLVLGGFAAWFVQCNYTNDYNHDDFRTRLNVLDVFQQESSTFSAGEDINFQLTLTNRSDRDLRFRFDSGQKHEFFVFSEGSDVPLWQWSVAESLAFTQAQSSQLVKEDNSWTVTFTWDQSTTQGESVIAGRYRVVGQFIGVATEERFIQILN